MTESKSLTEKLESSSVDELAQMIRDEIQGDAREYIIERILRRVHKRVKQNITFESLTIGVDKGMAEKWLLGVYERAIKEG